MAKKKALKNMNYIEEKNIAYWDKLLVKNRV